MNEVSTVVPDISVLIISWNDWPKLQNCLASLYREPAGVDTEILVMDNASADGTPAQVERRYPDIRLYRSNTNLGHTKAVNRGFRLARGRYILLLDSDTELLDDCLSRLLAFMDARPDVSLVTPRTFNTDGKHSRIGAQFPKRYGWAVWPSVLADARVSEEPVFGSLPQARFPECRRTV